MELFWEKGYFSTSMSDLVEVTGLEKKSFFREFGSKDELFLEVIKLYTSFANQWAQTALGKQPLGLGNIKTFFSSMSYGPNCKGCLMTKTINQKNIIPEESFKVIESTMTFLENILKKNLSAAKKNKQISQKANVSQLAKFLIYSIQGITTMGNYNPNDKNLKMVIQIILDAIDPKK